MVRARLAIFAGDLSTAEECYVKRANRPELAISMYKQFNRWTDAIALAERTDRAAVLGLKNQHMDYLTSTGNTSIQLFGRLLLNSTSDNAGSSKTRQGRQNTKQATIKLT